MKGILAVLLTVLASPLSSQWTPDSAMGRDSVMRHEVFVTDSLESGRIVVWCDLNTNHTQLALATMIGQYDWSMGSPLVIGGDSVPQILVSAQFDTSAAETHQWFVPPRYPSVAFWSMTHDEDSIVRRFIDAKRYVVAAPLNVEGTQGTVMEIFNLSNPEVLKNYITSCILQ